MLTLLLVTVTASLCAFCVWKALQQPKVLSITAAPLKAAAPKVRP